MGWRGLLAVLDPGGVRFAHHDHVDIDLDPTPERLAAAMERFTCNRFEDAIRTISLPDFKQESTPGSRRAHSIFSPPTPVS
jgi:hypothetical protein